MTHEEAFHGARPGALEFDDEMPVDQSSIWMTRASLGFLYFMRGGLYARVNGYLDNIWEASSTDTLRAAGKS